MERDGSEVSLDRHRNSSRHVGLYTAVDVSQVKMALGRPLSLHIPSLSL